uniref:Uncharacterized protein n=1 Tax=Arundo donax TaxID=35708 RepID=A0A0A9GB72_ARUDO
MMTSCCYSYQISGFKSNQHFIQYIIRDRPNTQFHCCTIWCYSCYLHALLHPNTREGFEDFMQVK